MSSLASSVKTEKESWPPIAAADLSGEDYSRSFVTQKPRPQGIASTTATLPGVGRGRQAVEEAWEHST